MWVIAALAMLVALIALALSVPLDLRIQFDVSGRPKFRVRLAWLFGLVSREIAKKEAAPEEKKTAVKGKRKPGKKGPAARTIFKILRTRGLPGQIKLLLQGILRIPKIKDLRADLKLGLGDPADTGLLFALIGPMAFFLGASSPDRVRVQPSFADEAVLEGSLYGTLRLRPIQFIPPLLRFVFSAPSLRVTKTLLMTEWKRKK